jgi:hypothetical protein
MFSTVNQDFTGNGSRYMHMKGPCDRAFVIELQGLLAHIFQQCHLPSPIPKNRHWFLKKPTSSLHRTLYYTKLNDLQKTPHSPLRIKTPKAHSPYYRLLMPGKKSTSGKKLSASVLKMKLVVAWSAPQKLYCLSPIPDHKRRGFGGLLS